MQQLNDIRAIQQRILRIGEAFHEIMMRYHIPYYMLGGTMLGAIRHKGFIPWDDDMDFGIPRAYFQLAREMLSDALPAPYRLLTVDDKAVPSDSYKIEDTETIIEEESRKKDEITTGLFIDIFPIDYCDNKWGRLSRNCIIRQMMWYNGFQYRNPSKFHLKCAAFVTRHLPKNQLLKLAHRLLKTEGDYMINYAGMWGKKELMKSEYFGSPVPYQFGEIVLFGVAKYDEYLKTLYGDYMQLPPEEKRHTHLKNCWLKTE